MGETSPAGARDPDDTSSRLRTYRDRLVQAYLELSKAYDKAVMTLSAGTLAISLTFVKDVINTPRPGTVIFLALAWTALAVSIVAILISMLTSQWALRKTIEQVDRGQERQLRAEPGGWRSRLTAWLNVGAAVGFVLGVALLAWFAIANIGAVGTAPHP